jgi:hypothetical protein
MNPLEQLKIKPTVEPYKPVGIKIQPVKIAVKITQEINPEFDRTTLKKNITTKELSTIILPKKNTPLIVPTGLVPTGLVPTGLVKKPKKLKKLVILEEDEENEKNEENEKKSEEINTITIKKPKTKTKTIFTLPQENWTTLDNNDIAERLPLKREHINVKVSNYYMNNREIFVNFINSLFEPYKSELENTEAISCENIKNNSGEFSLLTHQKIVRDYMNLYTPYRGLFLFFGLGTGKTLSSIAIAEGMKSSKKIIVMTPASLRKNYIEELKKGGDPLYKKNQFWEWISLENNPTVLETLSSVLNLSKEYIQKKKGAWLVNIKKPSNYFDLTKEQTQKLDEQLNEMIINKYTFINYNGIRRSAFGEMTDNFEKNMFDNSVVIIDEVHNFISRIVNKLGKEKPVPFNNRGIKERIPLALFLILYEQLLSANNVRIVFLTGTPIINYPHEIGVLFNILRGYIKTWEIPLTIKTSNKIDQSYFQRLFLEEDKIVDYIEYSPTSKTLFITRNPFGFKNKIKKDTTRDQKPVAYKGVVINQEKMDKDIDDNTFERHILRILESQNIEVNQYNIKIHNYKALPDTLEGFNQKFIDESTQQIKDINLFKRRIVGMTSYFRSAAEELLPRYEKTPEYYHIEMIPMSDYQFGIYEEARQDERELEKKKSKPNDNGIYKEPSSTYRIFSRLFCNFVMPTPPGRPYPTIQGIKGEIQKKGEGNGSFITILKAINQKQNAEDLTNKEEAEIEGDELINQLGDETYEIRIQSALQYIKEHSTTILTPEALKTYSPKYLNILKNIKDEAHIGLHLVYSQFRTLEGIGIFTLVLEANGFAQFKIKKSATGQWMLDMKQEDIGKPTFALYTGTEKSEEKEMVRNIYNGNWSSEFIPENISKLLKEKSNNNNMGEIIKVFMITSSGSEGITLFNTRYVHLMEPYWHPVRTEQVIGRARRICSHQYLPLELQTVEVYLYLMTFTKEQRTDERSIELRANDLSKRKVVISTGKSDYMPFTSDETLFEISTIKEEINNSLIRVIKETAIDCALYNKKSKEGLQCLTFGNPSSDSFSYLPDIEKQPTDKIAELNIKKVIWKGKSININGVKRVAREMSKGFYNIYDFESYENAKMNANVPIVQVGTLQIKADGSKEYTPI